MSWFELFVYLSDYRRCHDVYNGTPHQVIEHASAGLDRRRLHSRDSSS